MSGVPESFDPAALDDLPEPVQRYFRHHLAPGANLSRAWRLRMKGSIRVGARLPFVADQVLDGCGFIWKAKVPSGRLPLLEVTDDFHEGSGGMVGRIFGRRVFADRGPDAARSAATRAVMESTIVPATLLPGTGTEWTASSRLELRFRRPKVEQAEEVTIRLDESGRAEEVEAPRWHKEGDEPGSLLPFRCRFEGELDFNGVRVPEKMTAGWVKREFEPFFEARIARVEGISVP